MDVQKFSELSTRVSLAKERKARAGRAYEEAGEELHAARQHEAEAYAQWAKFVREQAGFGELSL